MTLKANLRMTPVEALAYFDAKGIQPSWAWSELLRQQHSRSFTVARATSDEVLQVLHEQVRRAVDGEIDFRQFQRELEPRLKALGWWGRQDVVDGDSGEITAVQLGSTRRLRTIFQTNVSTAYMAGRYRRYLDGADSHPYWMYVAVMDSRTRPSHAALNGRVWRFDDPVWDTLWPPNGWGCRCRVRALTQRDVEQMGVPIESGADSLVNKSVALNADGDSTTVTGVRYTDATTGKTAVFWPDPGWDYNPGKAPPRFDPADDRPVAVDAPARTPPLAGRPIRPAPGQQLFSGHGLPSLLDDTARVLTAPDLPPVSIGGLVDDELTQAVEALLGSDSSVISVMGEVELGADLIPDLAMLSSATAAGLMQYAPLVVPTLQAPQEVWLTAYTDGAVRRTFFGLFRLADSARVLMLLRQNRDGVFTWSVYDLSASTAAELDALRQGTLLFHKEPTP